MAEAQTLFHIFIHMDIHTVLAHGDLLESEVGQRHRGLLLTFAKRLWPRWIIRRLAPGVGLFMLINTTK